MTDEQYARILESNGEIKGLVVGITQRLDFQNGRLAKNEEKVLAHEKQLAEQKIKLDSIEASGANHFSEESRIKEKESRMKEKRNDWIWGALEKIIFLILGGTIFLAKEILIKLGILNIN